MINSTLSLLSKPALLLLLWLSFAVVLWQQQFPNSISHSALTYIPLVPQQLLFALFALLCLLSLLPTLVIQKQQRALTQQALYHKQRLKDLKHKHRSEDRQLQSLMQNEQFAYWEWHIKSNEAQFSAQWKKMIGLSKDELLNNLHDLQQRIHPKDQQAVQQGFLKILSGEQKFFECTHRVQHTDGHYLWVHDKGQVFYGEDGEIDKISAIRLDVSAQKWIEDELEVDATIIEHASEGIAIADAQMNILRCNQALSQTLSKSKDELEGMPLLTLLNSLQTQPDDSIETALKQDGSWRGELNLYDDDHQLKLASRISVQKIFHDTTQSLHYSFIHSDITDLKRTQKALDNLANIDGVTGLANRNKLYTQLEQDLDTGHDITLMFLDLDNFKQVNDTLGHDIGDLLLQAVGHEIEKLIPDSALLARVGGDEFVFYYQQCLSNLSSDEIAQRITARLKQTFYIQQHEIHIGSSIGIAHYPEQAKDRQSLMKAADTAMYHAKHHGKGQFYQFSEQLTTSEQVA